MARLGDRLPPFSRETDTHNPAGAERGPDHATSACCVSKAPPAHCSPNFPLNPIHRERPCDQSLSVGIHALILVYHFSVSAKVPPRKQSLWRGLL